MRRVLFGIYLPLLLIIPSVLFVVALTLIRNPQIPSYILGQARLHSDVVGAKVLVDGEEVPAVVYSLEDYRLPGEGRHFLIYAPGWNGIYPATMVDIDRKDIGFTATGDTTHAIFFSRYLIQTDMAYDVIWASDKYNWGYNPRMTVEADKVTYFIDRLLGERKIEIIFENSL